MQVCVMVGWVGRWMQVCVCVILGWAGRWMQMDVCHGGIGS